MRGPGLDVDCCAKIISTLIFPQPTWPHTTLRGRTFTDSNTAVPLTLEFYIHYLLFKPCMLDDILIFTIIVYNEGIIGSSYPSNKMDFVWKSTLMNFYVLCTAHCNIIIQYKPKKCTFSKLMYILFTHQQIHFLLNLEKSKIYIKIHIIIAPTCFGLRPSSENLYRAAWGCSKTETCRSDNYAYFNVNFKLFQV